MHVGDRVMEMTLGSRTPSQVVVIGVNALTSEALASCVSAELKCQVTAFSELDSWRQASSKLDAALILFSFSNSNRESCLEALSRLNSAGDDTQVIVFSDSEEVEHISHALKCGARGYVPTSTPLHIAMKAIRLVLAGGVFVPSEPVLRKEAAQKDKLTARGQAVLDLLQQGKSNKFIAHKLDISESTVKSHVRNIMRRLKASNRTEVAVKSSANAG
jgi:DNA-binding NarL/FixJ family response regulator